MSSSVRLDKRRLEQIIRESPDAIDDAVGTMALDGQRMVQQSFNASRGRRYKRGTVIHIASLPGYPPNVDTGKLMNAIAVRKPGESQRIIHTGDTEYAAWLEFGTSKMAARPFMRPMAKRLSDSAAQYFRGKLD